MSYFIGPSKCSLLEYLYAIILNEVLSIIIKRISWSNFLFIIQMIRSIKILLLYISRLEGFLCSIACNINLVSKINTKIS